MNIIELIRHEGHKAFVKTGQKPTYAMIHPSRKMELCDLVFHGMNQNCPYIKISGMWIIFTDRIEKNDIVCTIKMN